MSTVAVDTVMETATAKSTTASKTRLAVLRLLRFIG